MDSLCGTPRLRLGSGVRVVQRGGVFKTICPRLYMTPPRFHQHALLCTLRPLVTGNLAVCVEKRRLALPPQVSRGTSALSRVTGLPC
jgi:hypothetical protein